MGRRPKRRRLRKISRRNPLVVAARKRGLRIRPSAKLYRRRPRGGKPAVDPGDV